MPAVPSVLCFDEGFVITSMLSMVSAGICRSICARLSAVMPISLPLIHTITSALPRREISPSLLTSTDGTEASSSSADAPADEMLELTLNTLCSVFTDIWLRCPVTTTS